MNRAHARRTTGLLVGVLLGVAVVASACSTGASSSTSTSTSTTASRSTAGSSASTGSANITIQNFSFSPGTITVSPGEKVTVMNKDSVAHTVTATDKKFTTGDINPGNTGTFTAPTTPGRYSYYCMIHQYMTAVLVVKG
jgi:plastocyanin